MAAPKNPTKVLVVGASGYIGGTVFSSILTSPSTAIQQCAFSVLLRNPAQHDYFKSKHANIIPFSDLEDTDTIRTAAAEHDVVVNCSTGFATNAARALIQGLGERKRSTGHAVRYMHTSGTSNLGDRPVSKKYVEPRYVEGRSFLDTEDIDSYMRMREEKEQYPQRSTDVVVIDTGLKEQVPTYIIMPPTIWGKGSGAFNKRSIQIPSLCKAALKNGYSVCIGKGGGQMDHVHVQDLAQVYENLLIALLEGNPEKFPSGRQGIYFAETGPHTWRDVAEGIAQAGVELGAFKERELKEVELEEAGKLLGGNTEVGQQVELQFALSTRTKTVKARALWEPQFTREDFLGSFRDEMEVAMGLHD
ncbi:MAG: hypothetical protein Q9162_002103 [Coniocarpon cinnabarinum]